MAKIVGIAGMNPQQLANELQNGARFVQYQHCVSVFIMTFKTRHGHLFPARRSEFHGKGTGVDAAYPGGRVVGDSLGTDLYRPVVVGESEGRARSDAPGSHCSAASYRQEHAVSRSAQGGGDVKSAV
jgi:hypothetical protein